MWECENVRLLRNAIKREWKEVVVSECCVCELHLCNLLLRTI